MPRIRLHIEATHAAERLRRTVAETRVFGCSSHPRSTTTA
jgi:hypothetical protein